MTAYPLTSRLSYKATLLAYLQLTKPRIVLLLVFTEIAAMVVAVPGGRLSIVRVIAASIAGALAAGGASTLNQVIEMKIDSHMARTKARPLPSGRIARPGALLFGIGLLCWATLTMGLLVNWPAALLLWVGAVYYVVGYTLLLKRRTALNIVIGGGAGAIPVLVGYAAATGMLAAPAFLLFLIIFLWTPPHSWALALFVNADYQHAGIPMLPAVYGSEMTRFYILLYSMLLIIITLLLFPLHTGSIVYFLAALSLGTGFMVCAARLLWTGSPVAAIQLYRYSSIYLLLLFLVLMADNLLLWSVISV